MTAPDQTTRDRAIRAAFDADNSRQRKRTDVEFAEEVAAGRTAYLEVIVDAVAPILKEES